MKNLFDVALANQVKRRINSLRNDSEPQWGKMSVAQAAAHCASGLEMALGEIKPPRVLVGRLLGPIIKPKVFANDEPFRRNSPTADELVVTGERNLDVERLRLCSLIDKFVSGGASDCTTHPHPFFGALKTNGMGHLDVQTFRSSSPPIQCLEPFFPKCVYCIFGCPTCVAKVAGRVVGLGNRCWASGAFGR